MTKEDTSANMKKGRQNKFLGQYRNCDDLATKSVQQKRLHRKKFFRFSAFLLPSYFLNRSGRIGVV